MKKYLKDIPKLVSEYDFEKNADIDFDNLTHGSGKRVWWKCSKGHEWEQLVTTRASAGNNCPYCANKKVCQDNCLKTLYPELSKEWSGKNVKNCNEYVSCSMRCVFWKCSKCKCDWKARIQDRVQKKSGCPYCAGKKANEFNSLLSVMPEVAKEWSGKNKLKPEEITYGSKKKIWWKCKKCDHEWLATPNSRTCTRRQGCPRCSESKGEKLVSKELDKLNIRNKREYKFKELGNYRFDFALFQKYKKKPYAIIEFHGEQHYRPVRINGMTKERSIKKFNSCQINDKIKKQYCIDNNIKYLEIPYGEKDNAEKLIRKFIYDS